MATVVHSGEVIASNSEAAVTDFNSGGRAGDHIGWVEATSQGSRFVADGVPGPLFDRIMAVNWSDDGRRFCYAGVKAEHANVLADHQPGPVVANLSKQAPPSFSPDGGTLVYGAMESSPLMGRGPARLYVDHVPQAAEMAPIRPSFSAGGHRLAWIAQRRGLRGRQWAVIDGKPGPESIGIGKEYGVRFSPGDRHSLYMGEIGKGVSIVRDDVVGPGYRKILDPVFSPDGERFAAVVLPRDQSDRYALVVDGEIWDHEVSAEQPLFSPDSRHLAWVTLVGGRRTACVDGQAEEGVDDLHPSSWGWSPDSRRLVCLVNRGNGWRLSTDAPDLSGYEGFRGIERRDDRPSEYATYRGRGPIYIGVRNGVMTVVVGDEEVGPWTVTLDSWTLSDDGDHMAYFAVSNECQTVYLDGVAVSQCLGTAMGSLTLSPDGRHVAYVSTSAEGQHLALDDVSSPEAYDLVAPKPFFTADGTASAWGLRGSTVYRLSAAPAG